MKIIDFERKGNVVRFYLGADYDTEFCGSDWDDAPYEHNAGRVYDEYITGYTDLAFSFDDEVWEPSDGELNSVYSKEDMKNRRVPCIIVIPAEINEDDYDWLHDYKYWAGADGIKKYYFGDQMEPTMLVNNDKDEEEDLGQDMTRAILDDPLGYGDGIAEGIGMVR